MTVHTVTERKVDHVDPIELPTNLPVGPVNVYLIQGEKLTLVDTSPNIPENLERLEQALNDRNFTLKDIEQIVVTHHHIDHVGLLDRILEVNPVSVYGHPNARKWMLQGPDFVKWYIGFFEQLYTQLGVPRELMKDIYFFQDRMDQMSCHTDLDMEIQEGDAIPGLSEWRVIDTKGHAQSHISLYRESDGVLVAGDHIIKHISSNALLEPPVEPGQERVKTLIQYLDNLRKCQELHPAITFTGHGAYVDDLNGLIDYRLEKTNERLDKIKSMLQDQAKSGFQLVKEFFPTIYQKQIVLTISEVVGHLDILLQRNEIVEEQKDGVLFYRLV